MHELAVAQRMVEIVIGAADDNGGGRIVSVRLLLGKLTCVDPHTLAFAFAVATRNTLAEGCRLEVVRVPACLACHTCKTEHEREFLAPCPVCGALGGNVVRGRELQLDTIDMEEEEATGSPGSLRSDAAGDR